MRMFGTDSNLGTATLVVSSEGLVVAVLLAYWLREHYPRIQ